MAFNSRVYATAAFVCFAMLAPCAQGKDIQMLPPVNEGATTPCTEMDNSSRVLTWDGGHSIACATGVTASGGNVSASGTVSASTSVVVSGQTATGDTIQTANGLEAAPICGAKQALTKTGAATFACIDVGSNSGGVQCPGGSVWGGRGCEAPNGLPLTGD